MQVSSWCFVCLLASRTPSISCIRHCRALDRQITAVDRTRLRGAATRNAYRNKTLDVTRHLPCFRLCICVICNASFIQLLLLRNVSSSLIQDLNLYMAGLVLVGASYVRPDVHSTSFCRPKSMRSLGSCCKLFRQAALASRTNAAGFDATTRRGFALPRAALSRRSKEASRNVDTNGDGAADNKVLKRLPSFAHLAASVSQLTSVSLTGKSLGGNTQGSQLPVWPRHYHATWQCRTSETVSYILVAFASMSTHFVCSLHQ